MNHSVRSIATAIAGVIALGLASMTISAQATLDLDNRYRTSERSWSGASMVPDRR